MTGQDYIDGQVLLIDKPIDWTSFDVVKFVRSGLRRKYNLKKLKVGHAGTLDPKATGLLIVCTGAFTKKITTFQEQEKTYTGQFRLGATTASYDVEQPEENHKKIDGIGDNEIQKAKDLFLGEIKQKPPIYSAIKKDGKKLYDLARKGETVEIEPRDVNIYTFDVDSSNLPNVSFSVNCSKGTYIRSLAHDFGQTLGCGAYLLSLRRTNIGEFCVTNSDNNYLEKSFYGRPE